MSKKVEIFSAYFKEEEKTKVEEKIGAIEGFKERYEKVRSMQIDIKLDELEKSIGEKTDETFETRFIAFKEAIEKKEAEIGEGGIVDQAKAKVKDTVDAKKEKLKNSFKEKISKIPLVGNLLVDVFGWAEESETQSKDDNFFDGIRKKIFGALAGTILGFFGYNEFKNQFNSIVGTSGEIKEDGTELIGQVVQGTQEVKEEVIEKKDEVLGDNIETIKKGYYYGGLYFLKFFSGIEVGKNSSMILNHLDEKKVKFGDLKKYYNEYESTKNYGKLLDNLNFNENDKKIFMGEGKEFELVNVLKSLVGPNALFLIESKIKDKDILVKSEKFQKKFGNIYNNIELENLEFKDVLIILGYSLPVGLVGFVGEELVSPLVNFFGMNDSSKIFKNIIEEAKNRCEHLIPKDLINIFIELGVTADGYIMDNEFRDKVINKMNDKNYDEEKKSKLITSLDKIINFKSIIIDSIISNPKYTLGINEFDTKFIKKLNYAQILALYTLLNGNSDLSELDSVNKIGFYYWIFEVLGKDGDGVQYMTMLMNEKIDGQDDYFTSQEKELLISNVNVYSNKMIKFVLENANIAQAAIRGAIASEFAKHNINVSDNSLDYFDYAIVGLLVGGNVLLYKLPFIPLPIKLIVGGMFTSGGAMYLLAILNKKGVLKNLLTKPIIGDQLRNLGADDVVNKNYLDSEGSIVDDVITGFNNFKTEHNF